MNHFFFAFMTIFFVSCSSTQKSTNESFVTIEGKKIELFADEYGNGYMKQPVKGGFVYIPFVFPYADDESDSINPKNELTKTANQFGQSYLANNEQPAQKMAERAKAPIRPGNRTSWSNKNTAQVWFSPLFISTMK